MVSKLSNQPERKMQNITNYSDEELSMQVFNDEYLYNLSLKSVDAILDAVNDLFIYTAEQHTVLMNDLLEQS